MDIRNFFQPSIGYNIAREQKRNKRLLELPMQSPYKGFFAHSQPKAGGIAHQQTQLEEAQG